VRERTFAHVDFVTASSQMLNAADLLVVKLTSSVAGEQTNNEVD